MCEIWNIMGYKDLTIPMNYISNKSIIISTIMI